MTRESATMWTMVTARTRCCRWQRRRRCGRRWATRWCSPPRRDGGARGGQTTAGDGELIGEETTSKEVLMPEAIAIGSTLERVLDVAAGTTVLRVGSDGNRGGDGGALR
jgi:hypothetical protein